MITGLTSGALRKEIQRRFNTDPAKDPLRILIATDAAREGLNFQAHCADLFHFDLPWNPGRIEQRNGRIDRKLQPADEVRCHYFVLPQRAEDRVLEVLVRKTETIRRELGSLSKVIDDEIERRLSRGIRHRDARAARGGDRAGRPRRRTQAESADEELEQARERQEELREQIDRCRSCSSARARGSDSSPSRFATRCHARSSCSARSRLRETADELGRPVWRFPSLDRRAASDPSWAATLDTLRAPRPTGQKLTDWRREAPIRPVVFEDAGRDHRRDGSPAPRAARRAAASRTLSRAGVRLPRPLTRVPGAGRATRSRASSCSAGCRCTGAAPSACTRSWSQSPRAGSSRIAATGRCRRTRATPSARSLGAARRLARPRARTSLPDADREPAAGVRARGRCRASSAARAPRTRSCLPRPARSSASAGAAKARCCARRS